MIPLFARKYRLFKGGIANPTTPTQSAALAGPGSVAKGALHELAWSAISSRPMSNRAIWNVRLRHEWLRKPKKGKRLKNRDRVRLGMLAPIRAEPPKAG